MEYSALHPSPFHQHKEITMSEADNAGFGKFVPGFDFLQNLAKGASASVPQVPSLGNWLAPTLNVEELDKRIGELKNVQFWLEQNARALSATIQALEVQKMTLATLKSMNVSLGDVASAFKFKTDDTPAASAAKAPEKAAAPSQPVEEAAADADADADADAPKAEPAKGALVDPLQLWGALTQQFQQIASSAFKEVTANAAVDLGKTMAAARPRPAAKATPAASKKAAAKKSPARKTAARKSSSK
jgi:hypothetical protein